MKRFAKYLISGAVVLCASFVASSPADAQIRRDMWFYNACAYPVEFVVAHKDSSNPWHTHGWYTLQSGRGSYFVDNGIRLTQLDGFSVYIYARSLPNGLFVWQGNSQFRFQGAVYGMREVHGTVATNGAFMAELC
jgi:hypothetical protein